MNKPSTLRIVTILVPLLSAILMIGLIVSQNRRLHALEDQRTQITQQITSLDMLAREIQARPPMSKMAAAPPAPDEQPVFLDLIRGFANSSLVELTKYENKTVAPPAPESAEAKASALPSGVIALTSNVEVAGGYNQVRQFMTELWRSPRLFNTTDMKWSAPLDKWPSTRLAFTLTRYVHTIAAAGPAASITPTGGAAATGGRSATPTVNPATPGVVSPATGAANTNGASILPGAANTLPGARNPSGATPTAPTMRNAPAPANAPRNVPAATGSGASTRP